MTRKLNPKRIQKALRKHRFPKHEGWTLNAPTTNSIVVTNDSESNGPITIEILRDDSAESREAQMCAALGRLLLTMGNHTPTRSWGIAAPHTEKWLETLERIPLRILATFRLSLLLVSEDTVIEYPSPDEFDERVLLDGEDLTDLVLPEGAEIEIDAFLESFFDKQD